MKGLAKHAKELMRWARGGDFKQTDEGTILHGCIRMRGKHTYGVGEDMETAFNLIPDAGINHFLNIALGATAKESGFYLALFSGNVDPAPSWTAANFAANATEITSLTEGYSNATRPAWIPGAAASKVIGNLSSLAVFNVACTTSINVAGAGLLTSNVRGGTGGVLLSSLRYPTVRQVYNGDPFSVGYEVELMDS